MEILRKSLVVMDELVKPRIFFFSILNKPKGLIYIALKYMWDHIRITGALRYLGIIIAQVESLHAKWPSAQLKKS